ncbi:MoaD/ThiS family protein [Brevibacterium yomogidense]|uniref:MoaD/ThiS family protein n=1 Tax=Brevibacterium yomogidense TaxID=946573 RepID=UPI001E3A4297
MSPDPTPERTLQVRYFAAARAAAGHLAEEAVVVPERIDALTREQLVVLLVSLHPEPPAGEPSLEQVLGQSSILVNGVVMRDEDTAAPGMRVDVLPPFAGG